MSSTRYRMSRAAGSWVPAFACQGADQEVLPAFAVDEVLRRVTRDRIALVCVVPTLVGPLEEAPLPGEHDVSMVSAIVYGGSPIVRADLAAAVEALPVPFHDLRVVDDNAPSRWPATLFAHCYKNLQRRAVEHVSNGHPQS